MKLTPDGKKEEDEEGEASEAGEDIGIVAYPLAFLEEDTAPSNNPSEKMWEFLTALLVCMAGRDLLVIFADCFQTNLSQLDTVNKKPYNLSARKNRCILEP